ncbi:MAG: YraN family protein [Thermodesulfovibrio sp.]|nr:YraN family protein [Thermodesulfovibrio sp.]
MGRLKVGKEGERLAQQFLLKRGYKILEKNFRTPFGEADIIAKYKDSIVIVEVKTRKTEVFGEPKLAVNYSKQMKLRKIALYYLHKLQKELPVRFDVISIKNGEIEHIENAF